MTPTLYLGELPLILDDLAEVEGAKGQLDSAKFTVRASKTNWRTELAEIGIVRAQELPASYGYHTMWVNDLTPGERSDLTIQIGVSCLGLHLPDDKMLITMGGTERRISTGPQEEKPGALRDAEGEYILQDLGGWFWTDAGFVPRELFPTVILGEEGSFGPSPALSTAVPLLTVNTTWFSTSRPDTGSVGTVVTPPATVLDDPTVSSIGGSFLTMRLNAPHGWILTDRKVQCLFATGRFEGSDGSGAETGLFATTDSYTFYLPSEPA